MIKVFCYGSLKKGLNNHYFLKEQIYLGKAVTELPRYKLFEVQGLNYIYPALVNFDGGYHVYGEVYEINDKCLENLDRLEGVDQGLYIRDKITVQLVDGYKLTLQTYFYNRDIKPLKHYGPCFPIHQLPRWKFADKKVKFVDKQIEGVQLYDVQMKRTVSPICNNETDLIEWVNGSRKNFGSYKKDMAWHPDWYKVKKVPVEGTTKGVQLFSHADKPISDICDNLQQLAEAVVDKQTIFGGATIWAKDWKVLFENNIEKTSP